MNSPSHVIGGGYVDTSPPAIKCFALASHASPVEMAWEYAVKGIICLVHYGKGKNCTRKSKLSTLFPLNTRKGFCLRITTKVDILSTRKTCIAPICLSHEKRFDRTSVRFELGVRRKICFSHEQQSANSSVFHDKRIQFTVYIVAKKNEYSADLPWISRLFFSKQGQRV